VGGEKEKVPKPVEKGDRSIKRKQIYFWVCGWHKSKKIGDAFLKRQDKS